MTAKGCQVPNLQVNYAYAAEKTVYFATGL